MPGKYTEIVCVNCKKTFAKLRCPFCGYARKNVAVDVERHAEDFT